MKRKTTYSLLLVGWFILTAKHSHASKALFVEPTLVHKFETAKGYLKSFHNDSANIVLSDIILDLTAMNELNSSFGLEVQLRQAEALEKDHQDEIAIQKLLYILDLSQAQENWSVYSNAALSLARLHEKISRWENCKKYLEKARSTIHDFYLDSIYPRYAIRKSSYHRLHGDIDSALFYAKEVVQLAPLYSRLEEEEAVGHLLLGMILSKKSYKEATEHFIKAGQVWYKIKDYSGYGAIMFNLSKLHYKNEQFDLALTYNDSSLMAASKALKQGNEELWMFYEGYKHRANIFWKLEESDSAWYYINKGYGVEVDYVENTNHEKVVEIEERYNDIKKEIQLKQQLKQLNSAKTNQLWLWVIMGMSLLFLFILAFYFLQLKKSKKKSEEQNQIIQKTNKELSEALNEQILLQGEIHHRVKNNLQVIISLIELQEEELQDMDARKSLESMSNRIFSMAAIHEILYLQQGIAQIEFSKYTQVLCDYFNSISQQKANFDLDLNTYSFNLETLMPLGIILNELLTNSFKYATLPEQELNISIQLKELASGYCLFYKDNGPGFPNEELQKREGGLGSYLLNSMCRQLQGSLESYNEKGAAFQIFFKTKNQK